MRALARYACWAAAGYSVAADNPYVLAVAVLLLIAEVKSR